MCICVFLSFPRRERLPSYEWNPSPSTSTVQPRHMPAMINGRKYVLLFIDPRINHICPSTLPFTCLITFLCLRASSRRQNDQFSAHHVKRQRVDTSRHHLSSPPLVHSRPPHHRTDRAVAQPSRLSLTGFDHSYPGPNLDIRPQVPAVVKSSSSLHASTTEKVNSEGLSLYLINVKSEHVYV